MSYRELYQSLFDAHVISPFYVKPLQPPYPKWYDKNVQCDYHAGITGHSIENFPTFKRWLKGSSVWALLSSIQKICCPIILIIRVNAMNEEMLGNVHINVVYKETTEEETLLDIHLYKLGSLLQLFL